MIELFVAEVHGTERARRNTLTGTGVAYPHITKMIVLTKAIKYTGIVMEATNSARLVIDDETLVERTERQRTHHQRGTIQ